MTRAERRRRDRMRKAVELREKGFSVRAVAAYLGVSHSTILADLQRQELVDPDGRNRPPGGRNQPPESTNDTNVIPFNRRAAS